MDHSKAAVVRSTQSADRMTTHYQVTEGVEELALLLCEGH